MNSVHMMSKAALSNGLFLFNAKALRLKQIGVAKLGVSSERFDVY
ncbi:MAG: hypothetical protein ACI9RO_001246 [Alteromonas macleodii]|jgi:hypothetical protein